MLCNVNILVSFVEHLNLMYHYSCIPYHIHYLLALSPKLTVDPQFQEHSLSINIIVQQISSTNNKSRHIGILTRNFLKFYKGLAPSWKLQFNSCNTLCLIHNRKVTQTSANSLTPDLLHKYCNVGSFTHTYSIFSKSSVYILSCTTSSIFGVSAHIFGKGLDPVSTKLLQVQGAVEINECL